MNVEDVHRFFEHLNRSELEPIGELLAEDVVLEFPGRRFGGRFTGRRRMLVFLRQNQRLFRDGLRFTVHWAGVCDDRAVAQWTNRGVTRNGTPYANRGVTVFRIVDGKVVEVQDYLDTERVAETWPS